MAIRAPDGANKRRVLREEEAGGGKTTARVGEKWRFEALIGNYIPFLQ